MVLRLVKQSFLFLTLFKQESKNSQTSRQKWIEQFVPTKAHSYYQGLAQRLLILDAQSNATLAYELKDATSASGNEKNPSSGVQQVSVLTSRALLSVRYNQMANP